MAAQVLVKLGADLNRVREQVTQLVSGRAADWLVNPPTLAERPSSARS